MKVLFQAEQIINKQYKLLEKLGFGGFSEVWKAQDLYAQNPQEAVFALKIFIRQDNEGIELCKQEYLRTHNLSHPHVLTTLAFGVHESAPYLVMPYCSGGTMMNQIGECTERQIADFIAQVGSGLDYIHNLPTFIIHNDIKLDNFLINDAGHYLLSDFSISQRLQLKLTRSLNSSSMPNHPSGSAPMAYRPPESFKYKAHERTEPVKASDIWAFGASLYLLATGELPFPTGGGMAQLTAMADDTTVKISDVVAALPPTYSRQLDEIIQLCLSLETWDRPQAKELVAWAQHYQQTGYWWTPQIVSNPLPDPLPNPLPDPDPLPLLLLEPEILPLPKPTQIWKRAAAVGLVALIAGGGYYKINQPVVPAQPLVVEPPTPAQVSGKDAPAAPKPELKPVQPVSGAVAVIDNSKPVDKTPENALLPLPEPVQPTKIIPTPPPIVVESPASKIFGNPQIIENPKGIQISRVELTPTDTKVSCYIPYEKEGQLVTLFSGATPEAAFYLRGSDRKKYELKGVNGISFGTKVTVPQSGLKFTLFFAPLAMETKQFDMREGMDQKMDNSSYWNFIGIQLK